MIKRIFSKIIFNFERQTKIKKIDVVQKTELKEKHAQSDRMDPLDPLIDDDFISMMHLGKKINYYLNKK